MKKLSPSLIMLAVLGLSQGAHAANWLEIQGNEPANAPTFKLWGFLQPTYTYNKADKISGLSGAQAAPFNGQYLIPNLVGPDSTDKQAFQFNRARLGLRGVLNPVDKRINYFVLLDAGKNAVTREHSVVLTDASMTFNYIPGARIRVGLFKLPTGEEALVPVHVAYDYVYFSSVTDNLLLERTVRPTSPSPGRTFQTPFPTGMTPAKIAGSVSGFRDIGIQVYDWFRKDAWEFSYAGMVSNGNNINYLGDDNSSKDFTGRLQASYIFGGKGPKREDLSVFVWHQQGKRTFGSSDYDRVREGTGFTYRQKAVHVAGEYMRGRGMIFVGPQLPFNDIGAPAIQPVNAVALSDSNKADGWYLSGGYQFLKDWEFDLRYDTLNRLTNSPANERDFKTWTVGTQYAINKDTRLTLNYEFRKQEVTNPLAITNAVQRANAQTIADNLGDRISLQLTYLF
jgi:hypothetical protein